MKINIDYTNANMSAIQEEQVQKVAITFQDGTNGMYTRGFIRAMRSYEDMFATFGEDGELPSPADTRFTKEHFDLLFDFYMVFNHLVIKEKTVKKKSGEAYKLLDFKALNELKPFVEKHFPVDDEHLQKFAKFNKEMIELSTFVGYYLAYEFFAFNASHYLNRLSQEQCAALFGK